MVEDLLTRLKACKFVTEKTYKQIAKECDIPFSTFYNFTNGTRGLKQEYKDKLEDYLKKKGF